MMREVASPASQASMEATMARALSVTQASTLRRERQSAPSARRARGPLGGGVHAMIPRLPANLAPSVRLINSLCTLCEAGKFGTHSASGERICQYCTPGKYQNATGKINCIDCGGQWEHSQRFDRPEKRFENGQLDGHRGHEMHRVVHSRICV
jgi:hypothetical protein